MLTYKLIGPTDCCLLQQQNVQCKYWVNITRWRFKILALKPGWPSLIFQSIIWANGSDSLNSSSWLYVTVNGIHFYSGCCEDWMWQDKIIKYLPVIYLGIFFFNLAIPPIQELEMFCCLSQRRDTIKESWENRSLLFFGFGKFSKMRGLGMSLDMLSKSEVSLLLDQKNVECSWEGMREVRVTT